MLLKNYAVFVCFYQKSDCHTICCILKSLNKKLKYICSHFYTNCFPDIYGIYATNTFEQGVGIQASRFNHSCRSNAEEFWNEKNGATEIRSVSKINAGEEITINYRTSEISMKSYKTR